MPTLNRYSPSNKKTGFFVRANVGGQHPVTLQTTDVAAHIFGDNGYTDGSTIPTKLVWLMYDVGLLYTESSLSGSTPSYSDHKILSDIINGSELTECTRRELIEYFSSYKGSHQNEVQQLLSDLRQAGSTNTKDKDNHAKSVENESPFFQYYTDYESLNKLLTEIREQITPEAVEAYIPKKSAEIPRSFLKSYTTDYHKGVINDLFDTYGKAFRESLLTFIQRAPQLKRITTTEEPAIGYHFTPISLVGDASVYDLTIFPGEFDPEYEYRIEYRDTSTSSIYVAEECIQKINGPNNNLSDIEAKRLTSELTPTKIDKNEVISAPDAPPISEVELPKKSFFGGHTDLLIGTVDRISSSGNPVVELDHEHIVLDTGEETQLYLINSVNSRWGRVLCELSYYGE